MNQGLVIAGGVFFHYLIALIFTALLFILYPKLVSVISNRYVIGILYGVFIWLIMNLLVVPLSITHEWPSDVRQAAIGCLILIGLVGIPVAYRAHSYFES